MEILCTHCNARLKVADDKLPQDQIVAVACPKCKGRITIDPRPREAPAPPGKTVMDEVSAESYNASEKPFDFLEIGAKTALLCEPDPGLRQKLKTILNQMGFHTTEPQSARDALKQMRFHVFDVVVLNELFGAQAASGNPVLQYLDHLGMEVRRNIFVALLAGTHRTMDNMAAFNQSVNLMVNLSNIDEFEKILTRGLSDYGAFYRVFKESLAKVGLV